MQIKMIIDCGIFKKGTIYDVSPKKANTLLTRGVCVRFYDPLQKANTKKILVSHQKSDKKSKKSEPTWDKP